MIKIINKKFLIMLLISFIYAYLEGGNLPYSIFYGFLCTLIFSLVYLLATIRNVAVDIKFNRNIFTTFEDTEVITVVKNYGILPIPYIEINNKVFYELDKDYKGLVLSLGIDENRRLGVKVKFFTRGIYNFGEIKLHIRDIFSLFNFEKNIKKENIIKVYPKIYSLEKFNSYGEDVLNGMVNEKGNIKEDYSISDMRKYRIGDSLRKINWKVSAKHGELYIKNFDTVTGEKSNVFLNMNKDDYFSGKGKEKEEELIDLCVSLINMMRVRGIKTNLHICNRESKSFYIGTRDDFYELMEYLLIHKSEGERDFSKFIIDNLGKVERGSSIAIMTPKINEKMKDNLISLKRLGYKVMAFYSITNFEDLEKISILKEMDIRCISFNEALG
jgi:uncharacterized protein (DUF58 family)